MISWKPVVGFEGWYEVSSAGEVRSLDMEVNARGGAKAIRKGRVLKQAVKQNGYTQVTLCDTRGLKKCLLVHNIVAQAFIGPRPEGKQVCHLDGNPKNNALSNLRYDTPMGNNQDKRRHDTMARGERHGMAKLKPSEVLEIRGSTLSNKELALIYNVALAHICSIKNRRTWKHI